MSPCSAPINLYVCVENIFHDTQNTNACKANRHTVYYFIPFIRLYVIFLFFFTEDQFIFISGPVVVSPLESFIRFKTVFYTSPKETNPDTKWFQIQNNSSKEIPCYKRTRKGNEISEYLEIPNTEENQVAYQFCVENKRSNKINVFAEGMFL